MKKGMFLGKICLVIILAGVLVVSICAHAQTPKPTAPSSATALEKRLYQAALKEGQLNWWDQHSLKEATVWIKEFNNKYPGIKVEYFEGTEDVISEKYLAEYKAGRATADTVQPEPLRPFREQKLLLDLSDIIKDANYPLQFCLKELTGATFEFSLLAAAYNTKMVSPQEVPRSLEDLLNPKWKGKINLESRLKFFLYTTEHYGEEWMINYLKKLREQKPTFSKGSTASMTLLSAGEFPIVVGVNLHRIVIMSNQGQPVGLVPISPIGYNPLNVTCIPKTAPHPNAAKLFIRWWMSPEGQALNDKIRFKGNPLPGSGTSQSKILEKYGIKVFTLTEWVNDNEDRLGKLYQDASGFAKK